MVDEVAGLQVARQLVELGHGSSRRVDDDEAGIGFDCAEHRPHALLVEQVRLDHADPGLLLVQELARLVTLAETLQERPIEPVGIDQLYLELALASRHQDGRQGGERGAQADTPFVLRADRGDTFVAHSVSPSGGDQMSSSRSTRGLNRGATSPSSVGLVETGVSSTLECDDRGGA